MNHRALSILATTLVTFALAAPRALAHPGHGLDTAGVGLLHFLSQPSHGGIALAVAGVLVAGALAFTLRRQA